jgi:hypothetical protein
MSAIELSLDSKPDWRLRMSLLLTGVWLLLGGIYITLVIGWGDFVTQQAPELGSFLEGAFAPLAFLWLVIGFFLQQQQLSENTRTIQAQLGEMRRTSEQAEVQARAIAADELHSRQDTFLRVKDLVSEQLSVIAAWLVISYEGGTDERTGELFRRLGGGEHTAFSMDIIARCVGSEANPREFFYGTEIRRGHSERFRDAFARLLESGERCDPNGMIVVALRDGLHGRVYRLIVENAPDA